MILTMEKNDKKQLRQMYRERRITGGVYAIYNTQNGKRLLQSTADIEGSKNRFVFAQSTGTCISLKLQRDWEKSGPAAFSFEVLEELEKKPEQTEREFAEEVKLLEELWREKLEPSLLYH